MDEENVMIEPAPSAAPPDEKAAPKTASQGAAEKESEISETPQKKPRKQEVSAQKKTKAPPKGKPRQSKQRSTKQLAVGLLVKMAAIVLIVWGLFTFVLGITIHYGNNMHPMVRDGDLVFSLRLQRPFINAAVLYEHDGKTTVGRVIALEGSTVYVNDDGAFTVNGTVPSEEVFYPTFPANGSDIEYPYTVPESKVFILNDFREDTNDSRSFGAVDVGDLKGNLLLTIRRRGF